jgi:hypothetical protein
MKNTAPISNGFAAPIIGLSTLICVILLSIDKLSRENFTSGFGFDMPDNEQPLLLNMYKQNLNVDFALFNLVQTLKYKVFKPIQRGIFSPTGKSPIIIFPGLGESKILATWNKSGDDSKNVKSLDLYQNFENANDWSCRSMQMNWSTVWYPEEELNGNIETKGLAQFCWADNIRVNYDPETNTINNAAGVKTITTDIGNVEFVSKSYMGQLVHALESAGYSKGSTLFGASYDFRKICNNSTLREYCIGLVNLIEQSVKMNNGQKAVLVSHNLGSQLANYFLTGMPQEWKNTYIKCFICMSGTFGGCPKALRTLLSGTDLTNYQEKNVLREVCKNFNGIQWMLPSPVVYGDTPLVEFKRVQYSAKDIPELLHLAGYNDSLAIFENIVKPVQLRSMQAPNVTTYVFAGNNLPTESSYTYEKSLTESPQKNYPNYNTQLPYRNDFNYPQQFTGDGTMPRFALEFPMQWTKYQKEPVYYRFYNQMEHMDILSSEEPIKDLLSIVIDY